MMPEKKTRLVTARTGSGILFHAYEIHMGVTVGPEFCEPFAVLEDGSRDGVRLPGIIGTYLHGAFENRFVMEDLLREPLEESIPVNRESPYDRMADWFVRHVDHELFAAEYL